jgi:hypothetical protein
VEIDDGELPGGHDGENQCKVLLIRMSLGNLKLIRT